MITQLDYSNTPSYQAQMNSVLGWLIDTGLFLAWLGGVGYIATR